MLIFEASWFFNCIFWAFPVHIEAREALSSAFRLKQAIIVAFVTLQSKNRVFILIIIIFVVSRFYNLKNCSEKFCNLMYRD